MNEEKNVICFCDVEEILNLSGLTIYSQPLPIQYSMEWIYLLFKLVQVFLWGVGNREERDGDMNKAQAIPYGKKLRKDKMGKNEGEPHKMGEGMREDLKEKSTKYQK